MLRKPVSGTTFPIRFVMLACLTSIMLLVGCGGDPNMGDVEGVITLDGKPLPDAFVLYVPETGSTSFGKTDAQGKYQMKFSDTQDGVFIGSNRVVIRTGDVKPDNSGSTPELVPSVYNDKTTLTADVESGDNTFDWDLKTDAGRIEQVDLD